MLKAGIIGLGVGEQHIYGYNAHPDCQVIAACDFDKKKLSEVQEKNPDISYFEDANEILNNPDIDIISIASFDNFHAEQIIQAINNGKHLFVEKPVCLHIEEAREIKKHLDEHPEIQLSSNLILRQSPRFIELKKAIQNEEYGTLQYVEADYNYGRIHKILEGWRGKLDFYSIVHGGGVHVVDLVRWLTGDEIVKVCAVGAKTATKDSEFKFNDVVTSIIEFKSGLTGKIGMNFSCVSPHFHQLSIYGEKATFQNDLPEARRYISRDPEIPYETIDSDYPGMAKGDLLYDFVDAIINERQPIISKDEVFRTMEVCFAIEKSSYTFESVTVEKL